jgi:tRNA G18 (ribose-2'-O)-methylase SpoU
MSVERIECANDGRAAAYRDLGDGELLRERGLFVAEGRLVVRRVIADARYRIESLLLNDAALHDLGASIDALHHSVPVLVCDTRDFALLTGFNIHRGCLALVHRPTPTPVAALLDAASTVLVLDGVGNPDNVGGAFRNAAAFGVDGVVLGPTACDPLYRKAVRTSMAAALEVPFARARSEEWPVALEAMRARGFTVVALTPREPCEPLDVFAARPRPRRIAIVVGAEGAGVAPVIEAAADARVRIPVSGAVDSLNLAVAVGIALYALRARQGPA